MSIPLLAPPTTTDELRRMVAAVRAMAPATDDADGIERVRLFEELTAAVHAAQMREAVSTAASLAAADVLSGASAAQRTRGVTAQIALAKKMSPWQAQRWLGNARILISELPETFSALDSGRTTAWRAMLVARETAFLSRDDRALVDTEVAEQLDSLGDRGVERAARTAACRLDPAGAAQRASRAARDRHVSLRPAPDVMARLNAQLPLTQGVAAYASLCKHADTVIGTGQQGTNPDGTLRTRAQVIADTLVERLTGQASAGDIPIEINLVMPADSLIPDDVARDDVARDDAAPEAEAEASEEPAGAAFGDEPAILPGWGPVPAPLARELALGRRGDASPRWLRRLFLTPDGCGVADIESTRRLFTERQRRFLRLRDQGTCRTPFCDAPARHIDHIRARGAGGAGEVGNGQGLCEACNYAKQAPGWRSTPQPDGTVVVLTPTGQKYVSPAPRPPGSSPARPGAAQASPSSFIRAS